MSRIASCVPLSSSNYEEGKARSEVRQEIIRSFVDFHKISNKDYVKMLTRLQRRFQLTPTRFIEFISNSIQMLNAKRHEIKSESDISRNGLNTLINRRQEGTECRVVAVTVREDDGDDAT